MRKLAIASLILFGCYKEPNVILICDGSPCNSETDLAGQTDANNVPDLAPVPGCANGAVATYLGSNVTGCAKVFAAGQARQLCQSGWQVPTRATGIDLSKCDIDGAVCYTLSLHDALPKSEERRVGKECMIPRACWKQGLRRRANTWLRRNSPSIRSSRACAPAAYRLASPERKSVMLKGIPGRPCASTSRSNTASSAGRYFFMSGTRIAISVSCNVGSSFILSTISKRMVSASRTTPGQPTITTLESGARPAFAE